MSKSRSLILSTVLVLVSVFISYHRMWQDLAVHPAQTLTDPEFLLFVMLVLFIFCILAGRIQDYRCEKENRTESKKHKQYRTYFSVFFGILLATALFRSCGRGGSVEQNLAAGKNFLSLQALEDGELQALEVQEERGTGTVFYESGFLVREHYKVSQTGRVKKTEEDDSYIASLDVEYYNLYSKRLAGAILDEWIQDAISSGVQGFTALDCFNFFYLAETDEKIAGLPVQKLYARWGNRIIQISYAGDERLEEKLETISRFLE